MDDLETQIEDEDIAGVERVPVHGHLSDAHVLAGALELQETGFVLLRLPARVRTIQQGGGILRGSYLDVVEAAVNSALENLNSGLREVAEEEVGLMALDLSVLDGSAAQAVVELDSLVGSSARLVLRSLLTKPEVDIMVEHVAVRVLERLGR